MIDQRPGAWAHDKKVKAPLRTLIRRHLMVAVFLGVFIHGKFHSHSGKSVSKWFGRSSE
jgi:hypothetical protein